jgi:ferritin-like metal-binding protein YciE
VKLETLEDVLIDELSDMYNAEIQLAKELPKMAAKATDLELAGLFIHHAQETESHIQRLEEVFHILGHRIEKEKCEAMAGLIRESEHLVRIAAQGPVMDVTLITAAQKIEHYEIASYGALRVLAQMLGYPAAAELLGKTLAEERSAEGKLTRLAESLNSKALRRAA